VKFREAVLLRVGWAAKGSPPCDHPHVVEQQFMDGRPTGDYACTVCGSEVKRPVTGQTPV